MHMGRGPAMAAHLRSRPDPTTADPASEANIECAPLKNEQLGKGGSGHLGPDTPAGQKLITTAVSKAMVRDGRAQGFAASSALKLLVSKTTTDAAAACTSDLLMVTTLPPSWLDHLPCVPR
jgi:hypothetical protein